MVFWGPPQLTVLSISNAVALAFVQHGWPWDLSGGNLCEECGLALLRGSSQLLCRLPPIFCGHLLVLSTKAVDPEA